MKKTVNVNLGGRVFQIDDDAYRMLETYIQNIRALYQKEDPEGEIVQDFEQRLSDLLWEKKYGEDAVITVAMTEDAIRTLGPLEDIQEEDVYHETSFSASEESRGDSAETRSETFAGNAAAGGASQSVPLSERKKFFRNPDDKWISGVLGGLGALMGIDPLFLRILFILLMFTPVNWILIIMYFTFAIFIPKAKTVEDKLRMEGRPVSSSEIWNKISEEAAFAASTASDGLNKVGKMFAPKAKSNPASDGKTAKSNPGDSIMYWVIGIAVLLVVFFSIYWLFDFVGSGSFMHPETWNYFVPDMLGHGLLGGGIILSIIMVFVGIITAITLVFALLVLPLGLIIRSNMSGALKVILCLIWLVVIGLIAF